MAIRKDNVMLQVSVPKEVVDSMNLVCKSISKKLNRQYTKGNLITDIYVQWIEFQNQQIEEAIKEDKKDA
ncbi:MAG: hypothetical protein J6S67_01100 [Methanobrevibacter sp.]|nr:hypothetical protein [Methanobrevibacter sp.]